MNWDHVKEEITKEVESIINTLDPAFEIGECLDLYHSVLRYKVSLQTKNDLDGLDRHVSSILEEIFIDNQVSPTSIGVFCKNFEQFVKKIYYILEENEYIEGENHLDHTKLQALGPFLSSLNKIRPIYLDNNKKDVYEQELAELIDGKVQFKINPANGKKLYQRLYPSSISFDKYEQMSDVNSEIKYQNTFVEYLLRAIILKNEESHQAPYRTKIENLTNLSYTLISELWIINFFKSEIGIAIKKNNTKNGVFDDFIETEKRRLKSRGDRFISLNLLQIGTSESEVSFIEDVIQHKTERIRILGQGGSGKTTTLEYLVYKDCIEWSNNPVSKKIPVLLTLSNLSFSDTIIKGISKRLNVDEDFVEELLETNEIALYLDGVNEIVENRESKKNKLRQIDSLIQQYPKLKILITDRYEFDVYQSEMFQIPTFLIQKLTNNQIEEFVDKYCMGNDEQKNKVLNILETKSNIKDLFLRPLVLTRAIEIIKTENDLPIKEVRIIEKFLDIMLQREKNEKKDPLLNIGAFKLLLSFAANEIWKKNKSNAPVNTFAFNKILVEASQFFGLESFNAGYVSRIGYELEILSKVDDLIQFYHQSYMEFFCQYYLRYQINEI